MDNLVSMKRAPDMGPDSWSAMDQLQDDYGYGLALCLDKQQCAALGITELPEPGTQVVVHAVAVITRTSVVNDGDGDDPERSLSLQITDLALDIPPGAAESPGTTAGGQPDVASLLYGS